MASLIRRALIVAALFGACAASAQSWPTRQVRVIVPYPVGGAVEDRKSVV